MRCHGGHPGEHFIGIILLPIVGNACEHAAAVRFAMQETGGGPSLRDLSASSRRRAGPGPDRTGPAELCSQDKPGLSIGIAVGSSTLESQRERVQLCTGCSSARRVGSASRMLGGEADRALRRPFLRSRGLGHRQAASSPEPSGGAMSGAERARWAEPLSGAPGSHGLTSLSAISGACFRLSEDGLELRGPQRHGARLREKG